MALPITNLIFAGILGLDQAVTVESSVIRSTDVLAQASTSKGSAAPSLLVKAYAKTLQKYLRVGDLSGSNRAIFVAAPGLRGIPVGVDASYQNEQIFQHANSVQTDIDPFLARQGDFFVWYKGYVNHIDEPDQSPADEAKYQALSAKADAEYERVFAKWEKVVKMDPTEKFRAYLETFGTAYYRAASERDSFFQPNTTVGFYKALCDSAQARVDFHKGNNMKCAVDLHLTGDSVSDIRYRPNYSLFDFADVAKLWRDEYEKKIANPSIAVVDLMSQQTWASLGHSYNDGPPPDLKGFEVELSYTNIEAFDVTRGLWHAAGFRENFLPLRANAPDMYRRPIYKTTRLLLGYGVKLTVRLPKTLTGDVSLDGLTLLPGFGSFPFERSGNSFVVGDTSQSAYPVLLAVLAERC